MILDCPTQYDSQLEAQAFARHVENVARRFTCRLHQVFIDRAAHVEHLVSGIDQHRGGMVLFQQRGVDQFCVTLAADTDAAREWEFLPACRSCGKPVAGDCRCDNRTALVNTPGSGYFLKLGGVGVSAFRSPQKQITLRIEREVE